MAPIIPKIGARKQARRGTARLGLGARPGWPPARAEAGRGACFIAASSILHLCYIIFIRGPLLRGAYLDYIVFLRVPLLRGGPEQILRGWFNNRLHPCHFEQDAPQPRHVAGCVNHRIAIISSMKGIIALYCWHHNQLDSLNNHLTILSFNSFSKGRCKLSGFNANLGNPEIYIES